MLPKKSVEFPEWILDGLRVLTPPEKLTVSEWADKYRILDAKTSAEPGKWKTSRTPYLREVMDSFTDSDIEDISLIKPTQIGGTEALNNITGFIISQDQSPTMIVYPTDDLAEYASKNRIQSMIRLAPELSKHFYENESKLLELQFDGMYLCLNGANSPSKLASKPIRYLLIDERDKFPTNAGKEADPESLATERQKTFAYNKKKVKVCTPTFSTAPTWKSWLNADAQCRYYVPCPHCGVYQTFKFPLIKWSDNAKTADEKQQAAYYECECCKGVITDFHKSKMISQGKWKDEKSGKWLAEIKENKRKVAFHINTIYSPWVTFGDVAYEFIKSKDYPELLMNFVNSWLAEPWKQTEINLDVNIVLQRQSEYSELIVPDEALILTGGIDVQRHHFVYTVRAWGEKLTSWNLTHGLAPAFSDVLTVMDSIFKSKDGKQFQVSLAGIDSGDQTDLIYDYCAEYQDWLVPVKGSSQQLTTPYKISTVNKVGSRANGMRLYIVDTNQYKDMIAGRLNRQNGIGSWMVFQGCDVDYANQVTSEEKILINRGGRDCFTWQPKNSTAQNHYLDAEVYAFLAADLMQVRFMQIEEKAEQPEKIEQPNNWIKIKGNWIK